LILDELPSGSEVFIDANAFVYHLNGQSPSCRRLMERVKARDVEGVTGAHIVMEALHRLMAIEAERKGLITAGNPARKLRERPTVVRSLKDYERIVNLLSEIEVIVLPVEIQVIRRSREVRLRDGLLVHDSITVAMMEGAGLRAIATADRDFERVIGLEVYSP